MSVVNSRATGGVVGLPWLDGYGLGENDDGGIVVVGAEHRRRPRRPGSATRVAANRGLSRDRRSTYRPAAPTVGTLSRASLDPSRQSVGVLRRLRAGCANPRPRVCGVHSLSDVETPMNRPTDRTGTGPSTTTGTDFGRNCALCGSPGSTHGALLPDATVIDPDGKGRDGRRYVTVVGPSTCRC
jgi:hypothetical protein